MGNGKWEMGNTYWKKVKFQYSSNNVRRTGSFAMDRWIIFAPHTARTVR